MVKLPLVIAGGELTTPWPSKGWSISKELDAWRRNPGMFVVFLISNSPSSKAVDWFRRRYMDWHSGSIDSPFWLLPHCWSLHIGFLNCNVETQGLYIREHELPMAGQNLYLLRIIVVDLIDYFVVHMFKIQTVKSKDIHRLESEGLISVSVHSGKSRAHQQK
jgi:hypothetical protein